MATFRAVHNTNDLLVCPYDANHRVRRRNFQSHLSECERKHPDSNLTSCPFNFSHRFPPDCWSSHLLTCPDNRRRLVEMEQLTNYKNIWLELDREQKTTSFSSFEPQNAVDWSYDGHPSFIMPGLVKNLDCNSKEKKATERSSAKVHWVDNSFDDLLDISNICLPDDDLDELEIESDISLKKDLASQVSPPKDNETPLKKFMSKLVSTSPKVGIGDQLTNAQKIFLKLGVPIEELIN